MSSANPPNSPRYWIDWLASLPVEEQTATIAKLTRAERRALLELTHDWSLVARPNQLDPGFDSWIVLYQTGRGWGKSRTIKEIARQRIDTGQWRAVMLAAPTAQDLGLAINGSEDSPGFLQLWPPNKAPVYTEAQDDPRLICWNGAIIRTRSAQKPDRFRGPNVDGAICDEIDSWAPEKVSPSEAFAILEMTVRGRRPLQILASSTPKMARLVHELTKRPDCRVIRGAMRENETNLSARFVATMQGKYGGTRLGRQELEGELLDQVEGALVTPAMLEACRVTECPELVRVSIGVDPSGSIEGDEQGIVAAGVGIDGHGYIIADRSCSLSPEGWGRRAVSAYWTHEASRLVVEVNYGGAMVESLIRGLDRNVVVRAVTASRGKHVRFEPVAMLIEQGRLHLVGRHPQLEDQLCAFTSAGYEGATSPDRADAATWAVTDLILDRQGLSPDQIYGRAAEARA